MCRPMTYGANVWALLHAGDWACAEGDAEALARVAEDLAPRLLPPLATLAGEIRRTAASDLERATALWGKFAAMLRSDAREARA